MTRGPSRIRSRQTLFFVAAILVPCALLVALTVRMLIQENELADKRAADERRRLAADVGRELLSRLERSDVPRALVGRTRGSRLVLPWEDSGAAADAQRALEEPRYREHIARGERAEYLERDFAGAAAAFRAAATTATSPVQAAVARLSLGRTLRKAKQPGAATAAFAAVLEAPATLVDDQGVPVLLYACRALTERGSTPSPHAALVAQALLAVAAVPGLPPAAVYMARDVASAIEASDVTERIATRVADVEQALALQQEYPAIAIELERAGGRGPAWVPFGAARNVWLVGRAGNADAATVMAVRAAPLLASLQTVADAGPGVAVTADGEGPPLATSLPRLGLVVSPERLAGMAEAGRLERPVYLGVLAVVLSAALFGGYLYSRDVRRELHIANMRSQFVSSVSHELKTPLTAIRMFAETLLLGRSQRPDVHREYLETIVNESERLTRLLNNVLDFSKIEQGTKTYRLEPHSGAAIVRAAARAMEYPLSQLGFDLRVRIREDLPPIAVDPDAIQQALLNLLSNAMKYSGDGRVVEMTLDRDGAWAVISVIDHGIGIPAVEQQRIFEQFYRVQNDQTRRIAGTGLGLTLVDHVVRAHGGMVRVSSTPSAGSTFALVLPLMLDADGTMAETMVSA